MDNTEYVIHDYSAYCRRMRRGEWDFTLWLARLREPIRDHTAKPEPLALNPVALADVREACERGERREQE